MNTNAPSPGSTMMAVVTTGHGGYDKLDYREVPVPVPDEDEVLLRVLAAGVNNTEINTRLGWYSSSVKTDTDAAAQEKGATSQAKDDGGWSGATPFPLIQGTDCCGVVVSTGSASSKHLIGKRVLVRACMRTNGFTSMDTQWMASDFDGAFADYVKVPASEVFAVECDWSDEELATIPCAYGTAENMLHRASVSPHHTILVTGASGGVGSATIQLAKLRGAKVIAITSADKAPQVENLGADKILSRKCDLIATLKDKPVDVVVDNVAGPGFSTLLKIIRTGGAYVSSGAIAGPVVELDMRDMYLKDITLIGTTAWDEPVFPNLVSAIEAGKIRPIVARTFPLKDIVEAQRAFMKKSHVGNFVLIP